MSEFSVESPQKYEGYSTVTISTEAGDGNQGATKPPQGLKMTITVVETCIDQSVAIEFLWLTSRKCLQAIWNYMWKMELNINISHLF